MGPGSLTVPSRRPGLGPIPAMTQVRLGAVTRQHNAGADQYTRPG